MLYIVSACALGSTPCTTAASTAATGWSSGCGTSCPVTSLLKREPCSSRSHITACFYTHTFSRLPRVQWYSLVFKATCLCETVRNAALRRKPCWLPLLTSFFLMFSVCHQLFQTSSVGFRLSQTAFLHPLCGSVRRPGQTNPTDTHRKNSFI